MRNQKMPRKNMIVDAVNGISPSISTMVVNIGQPALKFVTVSFQGGRTGLLDMALPRSATWSYVLDSLRQANEPAYVEIDPQTNTITELLIPLTVTVDALKPTASGDAIEVELYISHAKHFLRRSNPEFQQMLSTLEAARDHGTAVIVTDTPDNHEIIDVRPLPSSLNFKPPSGQPPTGARTDFHIAAVTQQQARQMFELVNAKSCCPGSAAAPCITFLYPDDGCWGRAHEMCRLIIGAGVQPRKVWIYGNLRVQTQNHPSCAVQWGWHVAPTLEVSTSSGTEIQVIDPALFSEPVPQATWASVQGDPSATLVASDASVFHRRFDGTVTYDDAAYTETRRVLDTYRLQLLLRSTGTYGPMSSK
jgi:hypothetical protein